MVRERTPCNSVNHKFRSRSSTPAKPLKLKNQFFFKCTSTGRSFSSITAMWSRAVSAAFSISPVFLFSSPRPLRLAGRQTDIRGLLDDQCAGHVRVAFAPVDIEIGSRWRSHDDLQGLPRPDLKAGWAG